jgi:hypothetical protein
MDAAVNTTKPATKTRLQPMTCTETAREQEQNSRT